MCHSVPTYAAAEYHAIRSVMGHDSLRMNSTKSMIGHLLGGAGAVEAVATIKAIETGEGLVFTHLGSAHINAALPLLLSHCCIVTAAL